MGNKILGDAVLEKLTIDQVEGNQEIVEFALRDFIVGVISGSKKYPKRHYSNQFDAMLALVLMGSADDLDDVDWDVLTHPGSIIWPVLIAKYFEDGGDFECLIRSASVGYRTGRTIAKLFGPAHRGIWHLTETSGAVAATSALSHYLKLTNEQTLAAMKMTLTNMSGSPQAGFERIGATQSNRAAAATLAMTSVASALMGAPIINNIWEGPRGIVALFNLSPTILEQVTENNLNAVILPGTQTLHLRAFFATGFVASAIAGVLDLLKKSGEPEFITVELPQNLAGLLDGALGNFWWDPQLIMKSLVHGRDPFNLSPTPQPAANILITFTDIAVGAAKVSIESGVETFTRTITTPPFKLSGLLEGEIEMIHRKWEIMSGVKDIQTQDLANLIERLKILLRS